MPFNSNLINDLMDDTTALSLEAMALAVRAQEIKNPTFRASVLKAYERDTYPEIEKCEFYSLLHSLTEQTSLLAENHEEKRQQFICAIPSLPGKTHWFCVDILIKNKKLSVFFVECSSEEGLFHYELAALDRDHAESLTTIPKETTWLNIHFLKERFPQIFFSVCYTYLQHARSGCRYFALNLAIKLSKYKELHQFLSENTDEEGLLAVEQLPLHLGSLIKCMQSLSMYYKQFGMRNYLTFGGKKLDDAISSQTRLCKAKKPACHAALCDFSPAEAPEKLAAYLKSLADKMRCWHAIIMYQKSDSDDDCELYHFDKASYYKLQDAYALHLIPTRLARDLTLLIVNKETTALKELGLSDEQVKRIKASGHLFMQFDQEDFAIIAQAIQQPEEVFSITPRNLGIEFKRDKFRQDAAEYISNQEAGSMEVAVEEEALARILSPMSSMSLL